jgi:hypothetical protein
LAIIPFSGLPRRRPGEPGRATHAHLLDHYDRLRLLQRDLHHRILRTLSRKEHRAAARELGMYDAGEFVFQNESEEVILLDYCVYRHLVKGKSLAQRFAAANGPLPEGSDERTLLDAMCDARFRSLEVARVEKGVGFEARDLIYGGTRFFMDRSLGATAQAGAVLAGNTLALGEFYMSTGVFMVLGDDYADMAEEVARQSGHNLDLDVEGVALPPEMESLLAQELINAVCDDGMSDSIKYV